jgi:class 3 adenylate cyclase
MADPRRERKVVTVLFADLVGFTSRSEQLDPEDVEAILEPYHERLLRELERHGGTVEKFIGDAVMALFSSPSAHPRPTISRLRPARFGLTCVTLAATARALSTTRIEASSWHDRSRTPKRYCPPCSTARASSRCSARSTRRRRSPQKPSGS